MRRLFGGTVIRALLALALLGRREGALAQTPDDGRAALATMQEVQQQARRLLDDPQRCVSPTLLELTSFCARPYETVCTDQDIARYLALENNESERLSQLSLQAVAPGLGLKPDLKALLALRKRNPKRWHAAYKAYLQDYERRIFEEIGETRETLVAYFEGVRRDELRAIDAQAFPEATKARMRAAISAASIVLPSEYLDVNTDDTIDACAKTGGNLQAEAFVDHNAVLLCPTYLLLGHQWGLGASFEEPFPGSYETLAHELGHFIDTDIFPDELKPWHDCLRDVHGLSSRRVGKGKRAEYRIPSEELAELTADGWAAATVAEHLDGLPRSDRASFLREAYLNYCSGRSAWTRNEHMPATPRAKFLLGVSPGLRARMDCADPISPALPTCGMAGAVTRRPDASNPGE